MCRALLAEDGVREALTDKVTVARLPEAGRGHHVMTAMPTVSTSRACARSRQPDAETWR